MEDFYYSKEQEKIMINSAQLLLPSRTHFYKFFKEHRFTERVPCGWQPSGKFNDFIFVGTGTESDCTYQR